MNAHSRVREEEPCEKGASDRNDGEAGHFVIDSLEAMLWL